MTTREKPYDRARRECIARLGGIWTRREIDLAMEAIRDESDARAFADVPNVVSDWILAEREREAREQHRRATEQAPVRRGAEVVRLRPGGGG
jgi:hypothetical protein